MASIAISVALGLGGLLLQRLFQPKPKEIYGARLNDLNVPAVSPGNPIIKVWGTMKVPGQMIWSTPIQETLKTTNSGSSKTSSGTNTTNFTYSVDIAYGICQGPIKQVNRIWADQKLLYVNTAALAEAGETFDTTYYNELYRLIITEGISGNAVMSAYVSAWIFAYNQFYTTGVIPVYSALLAYSYIVAHPASASESYGGPPIPDTAPPDATVEYLLLLMFGGWNTDVFYLNYFNPRYSSLKTYTGTFDQTPDPTLQAHMGVDAVPAYRNTAYVVIAGLQLADFGNTIPTLTFEVVANDGTVYLHDIIGDICLDAGLDADEYDAMGTLPVQPVDGYAVTQARSGRESITEMQKVFPFDAFESAWKLKFNWVNQPPGTLIPRGDLGARAQGDQLPVSDQMTLADVFELPRRYNLKFQERVRDFSINHVWAVREVPNSNTVIDNEVTMALTRQDAKTWAEQQIALRFNARRTYKRFLPPRYISLDPGDVVQIADVGDEAIDPAFWPQSRIIEKSVGKNRVIELTFMDHVYQDKIIPAIVEEDLTTFIPSPPPLGSATFGYLMDLPLFTDSEPDNVGFYGALAGTSNTWQGGVLDIDLTTTASVSAFGETSSVPTSGTNYYTLFAARQQIAAGNALQTLDTNKHPTSFDTESEVLVLLYNRSYVLTSISRTDAIYNAWNIAMIGNELVQFCDVTDLGNGLWKLKTFVRGLRGTEYAMGVFDAVNNPVGHQIGDVFVQITAGGYTRVVHNISQLNVTETFKAITFGSDISLAPAFTFSNTGNSLRPRAPELLYAYKDTSNNRYLVWTPRARQHGGLVNGSTVTLDQPVEAYSVDVIQSGVVKATYALGAVRNWQYTTGMQATDSVSGGSAITFNLYEIGALIGRGFPASATI